MIKAPDISIVVLEYLKMVLLKLPDASIVCEFLVALWTLAKVLIALKVRDLLQFF